MRKCRSTKDNYSQYIRSTMTCGDMIQENLINATINGLGPSYNSFCASMNLKSDHLTLDDVIGNLQFDESH